MKGCRCLPPRDLTYDVQNLAFLVGFSYKLSISKWVVNIDRGIFGCKSFKILQTEVWKFFSLKNVKCKFGLQCRLFEFDSLTKITFLISLETWNLDYRLDSFLLFESFWVFGCPWEFYLNFRTEKNLSSETVKFHFLCSCFEVAFTTVRVQIFTTTGRKS